MDLHNDTHLYKVLKKKVSLYFEETCKSRYADRILYIKMLLFVLLPITGYMMLLFGPKSIILVFAGYMLFFIGLTLFVITIAHDASHQALFKSRSANNLLSYSWNILGISKFLWEIKHHHSHHIYTNIPHRDVDIAESPLLRFSPVYPYRSYYKYQHLYSVLLYFVFGVFIVYVKDFIMFFTGPFKSHKRGNLPRYFLIQLVITKLLFLTISLIIPLMVLPFAWWKILATYLICLSLSGALLLLVLLVPHINEDAVIDKTNYEMRNQDEWVLSQISTTVDSSVNSLFLNWFTGGLNTHLVHHLFPNICHTHYIPLTKIVKQVLSEHGIKYKENNFSSSIINHFKFLKLMGMEPAQFHELKH